MNKEHNKIMNYEIYTWDELKKLLPGLKVYDGGCTIACLQGILDFIEREKAKGELVAHTFQQVIPQAEGRFLYIFKISEKAQSLKGEGEERKHQIELKREKDSNYNPDDFHHETGENEDW